MADPATVQASYAMSWWIGGGRRSAGRVELGDEELALTATTPVASVERVRFDHITGIELHSGELRLEQVDGPAIRIGSLDAPGALRELAEHLSASLVSR